MPRSASQATRELWSTRLKRYCRSDLTVAEFCRREGVSVPSFYQWRKKLAGRQRRRQDSPGQFVPLQVTGLTATATPLLRLPGGAVIELPATLGREQLATLFSACLDATNSEASQ
ncbi:MAG: transposase [Planctomycetaceae bacterium]|nr:transposase [Planctomycetales bacterium]MCB9872681.1 transposase [Planctomycetaceae bacterium]MCB9926166.1 transposase [Planctomycetaceae bacterium]